MTTKLAIPPFAALLLFSTAARAQSTTADLPPAHGDPLRWEAVADSHVYAYDYKKWNESNWGAYEVLSAGSTATGGDKRIYLNFAIPATFDPAAVGRARLRLYHYANAGEPTLALGVHQVTEKWVEGTGTYPASSDVLARPGELTWKKQPAFDKEPVALFEPGGEVNKFVEADITELVHAWLKGRPNYGLVVAPVGELPTGTDRSGYSFFAREKEEADKRPVILIERASAQPDGATFATTPILSTPLTPGAKPRIYPAGKGLRISVPPSILAGGGRLEVSSASPIRPEVCGTVSSFGTYEISLGDRHEFDEDLVVECGYDPAKLDPDLALEDQILAARWDAARALWVELPSTIDRERGVVVTRTRHLSVLSWIYGAAVTLYEPIRRVNYTVIRTRHFRLYFDPDEIRANKSIARWTGETSFPPEYEGLWIYKHPAWIPFIRDLAYYLEKAYAAYARLGLKPAVPVRVEIGPGLAGKDPAMFEHAAVRLYVSSDKINSYRSKLKHKLAHELFHAVQNKDLDGAGEKIAWGPALWWIESTAEYAACRIAWDLKSMGGSPDGVYPYLLERPLTEHGVPRCPHGTKKEEVGEIEYDKGYIHDYLATRGMDFAAAYKNVASSYLKDGKLLEPFERYLVGNGPGTLPSLFRGYVGWFLFGNDAPRGRSLEPDPLESCDNPKQKAAVIAATDAPPPLRHAFTLPSPYSASTWAVRAAPGEPPAARKLTVSAPQLEGGALVDLYVLANGTRKPDPTPVESITTPRGSATLALAPGQTLYVTAVNPDPRNAARVTVEVQAESAPKDGVLRVANTMNDETGIMEFSEEQRATPHEGDFAIDGMYYDLDIKNDCTFEISGDEVAESLVEGGRWLKVSLNSEKVPVTVSVNARTVILDPKGMKKFENIGSSKGIYHYQPKIAGYELWRSTDQGRKKETLKSADGSFKTELAQSWDKVTIYAVIRTEGTGTFSDPYGKFKAITLPADPAQVSRIPIASMEIMRFKL